MTAGDVTGDSLPDIIIGDLNGGLFFHRNTGSGFSYISTVFSGIDIGDWSAPVMIDMDNDTDLDIVAGNETGRLFYFENTGSPDSASWTEVPGYFGNIDVGTNCVPAAGDLDEDGDIDIITGDIMGEIQYFRNEGGSWIEEPLIVAGISGGQNSAPALGDLDGDGDLDLTLGNYSGTFNYFENNRQPSTVHSNSAQSPEKFELFQNYPNPFNPTTKISWKLAVGGHINLTIYNLQGQKVKSLLSASLLSGFHSIKFDASDLPSGIYFYQLQAGGYVETKKMVVLK